MRGGGPGVGRRYGRAVPRSRWSILVVFALWTLFVWGTRIDNIWSDEALDTGAKVLRTLLALSFVAVALAVGAVAARTFRRPPTPAARRVVQVAALWTVGVWFVRTAGIVRADHELPFVVVHVVLALLSGGLAAASVWAVVTTRADARASADLAPR